MPVTRRQFGIGLVGTAFAGLSMRAYAGLPAAGLNEVAGYGELTPDPARLIDLPKGFSYRVISRYGNLMSDGLIVPNRGDGMGCFDLGGGRIALVRNHELGAKDMRESAYNQALDPTFKAYDALTGEKAAPLPGGTTTIIYNINSGKIEKEWLSLAGTIRNCSGGVTPWGSWLSCEENVTKAGDGVGKDHGYVFEVPVTQNKEMAAPLPLKAMGRFNHEAACVDPRTGIVYMTEDREDGLLYRYIPKVKGTLSEGGRLEALAVRNVTDSRNWGNKSVYENTLLVTKWIPLENPEAPDDDLRLRGAKAGATVFARGEGMWWDKGTPGQLYFTCTNGGPIKGGQIFRYMPSLNEGTAKEGEAPGDLELFYESTNLDFYNLGDNLCVMPTGHLMVCEDQYTDVTNNHLRGITPAGKSYRIARSGLQTEFAGACFSPDGSTLFVNLYAPTTTLAITGPWQAVI